MAGGIDWFRWHHGSVTDPKFQLVARKAGATLPEVLAVWAYLLEHASAASVRGCFGDVDAEAWDCLFGLPEGRTDTILAEMIERKLIADEFVVAWERRQPKRERDPGPLPDDRPPPQTSTQRSRNRRAKIAQTEPEGAMQRHATPCNASDDHATPREEESREEGISLRSIPPKPPAGDLFVVFWRAFPRKEGKGAAEKAFNAHKPDQALLGRMVAAIEAAKQTDKWRKDRGQYIPMPTTWLNQRRWEDEVHAQDSDAPLVEVPWFESKSGIEGKGKALGLGAWNEEKEQWFPYRERVFKAASHVPEGAVA